MAGALHDTVKAPHIARNFYSTPEQLLARLASSTTVRNYRSRPNNSLDASGGSVFRNLIRPAMLD